MLSSSLLAEDFDAGYAVFASAGLTDAVMQHEPPYLKVVVVETANPEAALDLLHVVETVPLRHRGRDLVRGAAAGIAMPGIESRAFYVDRPAMGTPGSMHLLGTEIDFVVDNRLVLVSVLLSIAGPEASLERATEIAFDLAEQQLACLHSETPCTLNQIPGGLHPGSS
jgi:hypothetical protein